MDNHLYALVNADANNALSSVRKIILRNLQTCNINLIDLTTSDTHFNATKVRNLRGYFLLGEKTPQEHLADTITNICLNLRKSLEPVRASIKVWNNYVKVIKPSIYSDFNDIIQKSINTLKVGSLAIIFSVIIGSLAVLLV
jgi:putative membrane protein